LTEFTFHVATRTGPTVAEPRARRPGRTEQRKAAHRDARDDGHAARSLDRAHRVTEKDDARGRAHERLDVDEGTGDLGRHPALAEGEEREGQQRATQRESHGGQDRSGTVRSRRHPLGDGGEGQHRDGCTQELHGSDRDRVAPAQQADLSHGEHRGQQQRREHQPVAAE
jgi:hypothetical protein